MPEVFVEIYPRYNRKFETKLVIERDGDEFHYLLVLNNDYVIVLSKDDYSHMIRLFNGEK